MTAVLFVGGGLDSATGVTIGEITGFNDTTYAPSALDVQNGQSSWAIFTCLDPTTMAATTVTAGQTWFGHFSWNFTNPYSTTNKMTYVRDSSGNPWVAILCNGGSPTFGLYYNSGTGGTPVWTQLGANFSMPQNTGPYQRLDIKVFIDGAGTNHSATVFNKEVQQATGTFSQASFTNIQDMQIFAGGGASNHCMIWEVAMTQDISTVGCRIGYSLPNGAGANSGWVGAYTDVNETVCNDATVNTSSVAGQKTTYAFGDLTVPASNIIRTVFRFMRAKNDGSSPANIKSVCRSGGTDYLYGSNVPGLGITFGPTAARYDVDPATSVGWTQTGFNAAEFGYQSAA